MPSVAVLLFFMSIYDFIIEIFATIREINKATIDKDIIHISFASLATINRLQFNRYRSDYIKRKSKKMYVVSARIDIFYQWRISRNSSDEYATSSIRRC